MLVWPLILALGYYLAPLLGLCLWLHHLWQLRSGWLRALATGVFIMILASSLNSQFFPAYNPYWMLILATALILPYFLPSNPRARVYRLATQGILLLMGFALHLWYCYLYQRPQFDNSPSYYMLPCLSISITLALLLFSWQKNPWLRISLLILATILGLALGQFFYLNA